MSWPVAIVKELCIVDLPVPTHFPGVVEFIEMLIWNVWRSRKCNKNKKYTSKHSFVANTWTKSQYICMILDSRVGRLYVRAAFFYKSSA